MEVKYEIIKQLTAILADMGVSDVPVVLEKPASSDHGDYSSNAALVAAKKLGRSPMELAEGIVEEFRIQNSELKIQKIEAIKPGFINIFLDQNYLLEEVKDIVKGKNLAGNSGKEVVIEYSSPNIAKPFTIGHLRSTIIGDAVANLLEVTGYTVYRDNHIGDWGTQFGKQIYAIKEWGNEEEIEQAERPVKVLVDLYIKFHEEAEKDLTLEDKARAWFKKLEDGDDEARELWQKCIEWSWKEFEAIYQQLGVPSRNGATFENNGRGYGEAFFEDKMQPVLDELKEKGLLTEGKEGAQIVEFSEDSKLPPLMILKKDGATLYATRDLATDRFRLFEKYNRELLIINEVGAEQALYFRQLYALEGMLGWVKSGQRIHIRHGLYRFKDQKMSTRKGNVIWLEDVLEEARKRAAMLRKQSDEFEGEAVVNTDKIISIGALKWNDLKRSSEQDVAFDWDDMLSMQGNSGPYIQYAYVRTQSVLRKAKEQDGDIVGYTFDIDEQLEPEEEELLRFLSQFPEVIIRAAESFAPHHLTTYLFELAQYYNLFYQKLPILQEGNKKQLRLFLTRATGHIIKQGLGLLGIDVPERM